ncbi:MAG: ribulose-phosphate 3-epimerase [Halobacteriovoraceae bacterium]|nr:ribulose-phosphate 3-epimerase [Halobacteriovoraceae bacterium]
MITISPSLLSCDFLNMEKEMVSFLNVENLWFHLDIMDGHFVPNLTFGHPIVKKICEISSHNVDVHLMVTNPEFYIKTFKKYKIYNLTFHLESCNNPQELVETIKKDYPSAGISIRPDTKIEEIPLKVLSSVDLLLVMSVMPGFSGQKFMEQTYDKLDQIIQIREKLKANFKIQVDGGVSEENAEKLIRHGVDNLVAGSYIFNVSNRNYIQKVAALRKN